MREFGYNIEEIKTMPATTFYILLDEMKKQAEKEKEEMNKSKRN
jgi:hypothetical protein